MSLKMFLLAMFGTSFVGASDLSGVANALAQGFLEQIEDESESLSLSAFLDRFKSDVKTVLAEKDVLPDLKGTQAALLEALDSSV
jgi:hypothetical protein